MGGSELLEIDDALDRVLDASPLLAAVEVGIDDADGSVLAEDVLADSPLPPFDSSAMDGFAVRSGDTAGAREDAPVRLPVIDESRAGHPATAALRPGQAIAISTGAVLPAGADGVVRVELTRSAPGGVELLAPVAAGAELRRAGEDLAAGERVIERGRRLAAAELGMLAAVGRSRVRCAPRPRVAVIATGDELLAARRASAAGELAGGAVHDSNSHSVASLARAAGAEVVSRELVGDDAARTLAAIEAAAAGADALVICGGVSVGAHDHVRPSLRSLGAEQSFWGLALRPGHPTWFGTLGGRPVFGLPGNPVSAMVTFTLLAAPSLRAMQGAHEASPTFRAALDGGYEKPAGRAHAVRVRLAADDDGWHASSTGNQSSNVISSMVAADALAIIPSATTSVASGERVHVHPLRPWPRGGGAGAGR